MDFFDESRFGSGCLWRESEGLGNFGGSELEHIGDRAAAVSELEGR